jgi:hypothetical protein
LNERWKIGVHITLRSLSLATQLFYSAIALCRGDRRLLADWLEATQTSSIRLCIALITLGCGAYGFTVGLRNGWEMGAYVAIKLPLIIFITLLFNGLLNGLLGLVLGSGIGVRKSTHFLLTGFAIMAVILGAISPVSYFVTLNMPASGGDTGNYAWHGASLLIHTCLIAYAGIMAHSRLLHYVREFADSSKAGTRVFFAWLTGNLFVGAQISWNLRPFFVSPGLKVEFLRDDPFNGNFYEAVIVAIRNVTQF